MKSSLNFLIVILLILFSFGAFSQHQETNEKPHVYQGGKHSVPDSGTILYAFKKGTFHGHLRYYFMATDNAEGLTDYYANAGGGGLHYQTAPFKNFQFGVSGFYVFNLGSSKLSDMDSLSGQPNRYEIGLFDQEDPHNHKDIDRLEELFLKYHVLKGNISAGRQLINTPFINLQDGRMRPTGVEGFWYSSEKFKRLNLQLGYLYAISPRGTTKWYTAEHSIGLYAQGVNTDGSKASYHEHIESSGIFTGGFTYTLKPWLKVTAWDLYLENVLNSGLLQFDFSHTLKNGNQLYSGAQFIRQDAINYGGNEDQSKTYIEEGAKSMSFGGKVGVRLDEWDVFAAYNRITDHGRYLMPREWGRDPFFTFMPRERNEGFGDVHAFVINGKRDFAKWNLKTKLSAGYFSLPDVKNYALNKYGMPSYAQINADVRYTFPGVFKGLEAQLLVVYKHGLGETYEEARYEINKVNMVLWNFVLNFHF